LSFFCVLWIRGLRYSQGHVSRVRVSIFKNA